MNVTLSVKSWLLFLIVAELTALSNGLAAISHRRDFLVQLIRCSPCTMLISSTKPGYAASSRPLLSDLQTDIEEARRQLDQVPKLLKESKWDSVRAILITPPLSDCWTKSSRKYPLLPTFAEALGDAGGDELAALEAKEDIISHLRYLDMAVYNNVFNPIATEGETGATKELIRSYYEDPVNEYKASVAAFDAILDLVKDTK